MFFPNRKLFIGFNLTMSNEMKLRGYPSEVIEQINYVTNGKKLKGEFIIVVDKK
jgi:16S rRNA C1402 (ribose-2'-O) methylase RsmI